MGPVPNGSDLKIMTDIGLLFTQDLLTIPSIRSRSGPSKKQVQFLETFRSQTDPSMCKYLDQFLLVLRRHFESHNVLFCACLTGRNSCFSYFDSVPNHNRPVLCGQRLISGTVPCEQKWSVPG